MNKNKIISTQVPSTPLIQKLINVAFILLFFLAPILISIKSTELFEFPKMLFVYVMTAVIVGLWVFDTLQNGKLIWKKSWIDILFGGVLLTQLISSLVTLDRYTSFFGYYSRFHGGFLSTLCYILLAWIFKNYATKSWVENIILSSLASASLVCLYGIGEHFGIDAQFWVQDVQNRVFSTLGQPNWLSAWLGALLPFAYLWFIKPPKSFWPTVITLNIISVSVSYGLTYAFTHNPLPLSGAPFILLIVFYATLNGLIMIKARYLHEKLLFLKRGNFLLLIILMQLTILFTKSRSGILALIISTALFFLHELISNPGKLKEARSSIVLVTRHSSLFFLSLVTCCLVLLTGTEWTPSLAKIMGNSNQVVKSPLATGSTNPGITDSTDIRQVVWQGAVKVWQNYPLFGAGTETFAYSYYNFRPKEHNLNSEWDFLYNKAHNEYLNFLANNGLLGMAMILSLILAIIWITVKSQIKPWLITFGAVILISFGLYLLSPHLVQTIIHKIVIYPPLLVPLGLASFIGILMLWLSQKILPAGSSNASGLESACLATIASIFITNFYGFSVVTIGLIFFMIPVWLVIGSQQTQTVELTFATVVNTEKKLWITWIGGGLVAFGVMLGLIFVYNYYQADLSYNYSENYLKLGDVLQAGKEADTALQLHPGNANYLLQKGLVDAQTAFVVSYKDASDSSGLVKYYSGSAVNFTQQALLKNQVHVNLYKIAARVYITLGLIDPKYTQFAIKTLEMAGRLSPTDPQIPVNMALLYQQDSKYDQAEKLFKQAIELKPDYLQAHFLLAQMFEEQKDYAKAITVYQNVLNTVDPIDITSTKKIKELKNK